MNPHPGVRSLSSALLLMGLVVGCKSAAPPDDATLTTAIVNKLGADGALSGESIQTTVQSGVAILQGRVSSPAAKELAGEDAGRVAGVHSVVNQLEVGAPAVSRATPPPARSAAPPAASSPRPPSPVPARLRDQGPPQHAENPAPIERRYDRPAQNAAAQPPRPMAPPQPVTREITLEAGTQLPVRVTQTLDSATTQPGDTFSGVLASDVTVEGVVVLAAGTTVGGRVDEVHEAGHFKGSSLLTVSLITVNRRGDRLTVATDPYTRQGNGRGMNTVKKAGGGAAVGAILGGILGGGKGAAIGAAAGGGAGAGINGVTRGQQVQIASESTILFRLSSPISVRTTMVPGEDGGRTPQRHPLPGP